jgi:hypothetical protein
MKKIPTSYEKFPTRPWALPIAAIIKYHRHDDHSIEL